MLPSHPLRFRTPSSGVPILCCTVVRLNDKAPKDTVDQVTFVSPDPLATKYFGGHSDLLSGVLVVNTAEEWRKVCHTTTSSSASTDNSRKLWSNRTYFGNTMGSLESWLLLRSLRTLHLRVPRQSQTATALAAWLQEIAGIPTGNARLAYCQYFLTPLVLLALLPYLTVSGQSLDGVPGGLIARVQHASLQDKTKFDPATQLTGGYPATFAITLARATQAKALPHRLKYWIVSPRFFVALFMVMPMITECYFPRRG